MEAIMESAQQTQKLMDMDTMESAQQTQKLMDMVDTMGRDQLNHMVMDMERDQLNHMDMDYNQVNLLDITNTMMYNMHLTYCSHFVNIKTEILITTKINIPF